MEKLIIVDIVYPDDGWGEPCQKAIKSFWSFCGRNSLPAPRHSKRLRRIGNKHHYRCCMSDYLITVAKLEDKNEFEVQYVSTKPTACHSVEEARKQLRMIK